MTEQVPELIGLKLQHANHELSTFEKIKVLASSDNTLHLPSVPLGLSCLAFLVLVKVLKKKYPRLEFIPQVLLLVVIMILLSFSLGFEERGFHVLGKFPNRLLPPKPPQTSFEQLKRLWPDVITITLSGFIESQSVTRQIDADSFPSGDRELFALGTANIVGSIFGSYVTFGSLPRSRILANAGSRSNVAGLISAFMVFVFFSAAAPILAYLPRASLGAIVFNAAIDLIEVHEIVFLFKMRSLSELFLFLASLCITFFLPIGQGIFFCVLLAAFNVLKRASTLNVSMLGYLPSGIQQQVAFVDLLDHPYAQMIDRVLLLSIKGNFAFYNAGRFRKRIDMLLKIEEECLRNSRPVHIPSSNSTFTELFVSSHVELPSTILFDWSSCNRIDVSGLYVLYEVIELFQKRGIRVLLSGIRESQLGVFQTAGILDLVHHDSFKTVQQAMKECDVDLSVPAL